ncbi:hypothetical protein [Streptomyces aidingensis]|uniref:Uncharacterized protein n=1 Tax=Streptomyces aidingensis TaxID=910347 RepID=A0A1I1HL33_9ACTN|nr:hypothetical protein [Streptomyces aidingensis]SFC24536.1 hypothetical protein SAMN05421773_102430 [Streptomyces aidingensis]
MNQAARRIGRSLALVLPVVLVLSGTLAVARVPWAVAPAGATVLPAGAEQNGPAPASAPDAPPAPAAGGTAAGAAAPEEALRDRLVAELQQEDPAVALTSLQYEVDREPSLARHCADIARALGRAAVEKYGSALAQEYARPVCDTSYAAGVLAAG